MQSDIVGVWTLRAFSLEAVETGEELAPFGSDPRGTLILHPDGRMVALITPGTRPAPPAGADQAAGAGRLIAYSGRYRLEPPDRLVTAVDVASVEEWVGTEQARTFRLHGDRLDILTPPGRMPRPGGVAVAVSGVLSWVREAPPPARASG